MTTVTKQAQQDPAPPLEAEESPQVEGYPRAEETPQADNAQLETEVLDAAGESRASNELSLELPPPLQRAVEIRVDLWKQILELERLRGADESYSKSRDLRAEVSRQNAEIKRLPTLEKLQIGLTKLVRARSQAPYLDETEKSVLEHQNANTETPLDIVLVHRALIDIGIKQNKLLTAQLKLDAHIVQSAETLVQKEPLVTACERHGVDARKLFAWTYYARGLEMRVAECKAREDAHRAEIAEAKKQKEGEKSGLLSKIRGDKSVDPDVAPLDPDITHTRLAAARAIQTIEPSLSEMFWELYEELAVLFACDTLQSDAAPHARALLRYGMVTAHPALIAPEKSEYILNDCRNDVYEWRQHPDETYVVYPDEYIHAIVNRHATVSPDEELELNGRGSDTWKADRVWRKAVYCQSAYEIFSASLETLKSEARALEARSEKLEAKLEKLRKKKGRQQEARKVDQELSDIRSTLALSRLACDKLEEKFVLDAKNAAQEANMLMADAHDVLPPETIVRREAQFTRRMARLAARLKTPYPHFVLREHFAPGKNNLHTRKDILDAIKKIEFADPFLFHRVLAPNKKRDRRLTVRMSPTVLIVPAVGLLGLALSARRPNESGKLMLPLLGQRQDALFDILLEIFSDFGWDCSMEEAGADWMKADELCAAYATVRWNYRNKPQDVQEKAGFNKKNKDRTDWRGHYALYVKSAEEAGKKLYFKCYEAYEVVVKYLGLPPGMERLRRD